MEKQDGFFQIFYKDGWAYLTVFPPGKSGRPVYSESVTGRLQLLGVPPVREKVIRDIIDKSEGKPVRLIPWPDGEKLGPEIEVTISDDFMTASVKVTPEKQGGEPLSIEMLINALKESGVVSGIQEEIIKSLIEKKAYGQAVPVAHGNPPIDEESARIEYLFETDRGKPFRELEYERIDLKELNFIQNKEKGDLLARLLAPVKPENGEDVMGNSIPPKTGGTDSALKTGPGAAVTEDGRNVRATETGNVKLTSAGITVEPVIIVENVDYSNGNMDFTGSVDIQGRIADGFMVKAEGDIQIGKSVSRMTAISGGDLILKAGISGNDEGVINCGGDLYARYIENAEVYCKGSIYVEEAIMHSRIKVEKDIILSGKRAEIFGGMIVAGGSVRCKKLGNINETPTEIHLGLKLEDFKKHEALDKKIKQTNIELDNNDSQIRQIKSALKKGESTDIPLEKLSVALGQLEEKSVKLNSEISQDLREIHEMVRQQNIDENSHLAVEQQIFGQVSIFFGAHRWVSRGKGTSKTVLMVKQGKLLEKGQE